MAIVFPQWYDQVILDKEGLPAASGNVNAFYAGTQTPAPTYNDNNQANPLDISIDSAGRVEMKLDDSIVYDIYMYDIEGALIKTRPGVIGGGAGSGGDGVQSVTSGNDGIFVDNSDPDNPKIENAKPETYTVLSNTSDTVPGMLATKIVSTDGSVDVGTSADATDGVRIDLSVDAVEEAPLTGEIYGRESGTWAETRTKASIDGTDVESFTSTGAQGDQTLSIKRSDGSEETVDILIAVTDETLSGSGTSASPLSVSGIMDRVTSLNASTGVTDSWVKIVDIDMGEDSQASLNLKLKSDSLTELNSAKIKIVQDQCSWSVSLQECLTSNSDGSPWIASTSPVQFSTSGSVISIWIGYYYVSSARFIDYVQWGKPYELMNVNSVTEYDGAVWTTSAPSTIRVLPNEVQIIEYTGARTLFDGLLTANGGISTTDITASGALNVSGLSTVAGVVASGNIVPDTTDFQNLGSVTNRWQNLHALLGSFTGPLTASGGISTTDIDVSGDIQSTTGKLTGSWSTGLFGGLHTFQIAAGCDARAYADLTHYDARSTWKSSSNNILTLDPANGDGPLQINCDYAYHAQFLRPTNAGFLIQICADGSTNFLNGPSGTKSSFLFSDTSGQVSFPKTAFFEQDVNFDRSIKTTSTAGGVLENVSGNAVLTWGASSGNGVNIAGNLGVDGSGSFGADAEINSTYGAGFKNNIITNAEQYAIRQLDDGNTLMGCGASGNLLFYARGETAASRSMSFNSYSFQVGTALIVGGNTTCNGDLSVGTNATIENGFLQLTRTGGANGIIINETGAANPSLLVTTQGRLRWGDPSTAADTELYRDAANSLYTPDKFSVGGALSVGGAGAFGETVGINNSAGVRRFNMGYDVTPDDFVITSRDDAGSYRDTPISIGRNTSDAVAVNRALTVAGEATFNGRVINSSGYTILGDSGTTRILRPNDTGVMVIAGGGESFATRQAYISLYGGAHATKAKSVEVYAEGGWTFNSGDVAVSHGLNLSGIPTSSSGLSTGDVWNDSGTLKIV